MPIYKIRGIDVDFPFEAYDCQIVYMEKVIQSLQERCNALLESPTGTGKTLCLLCATLAWRKSFGDFSTRVYEEKSWNSGSQHSQSQPTEHPQQNFPIIIYASRTHSQLKQVIRELKTSSYRPKMVVLGSREQMCINDNVRLLRGAAQNKACHKLCRKRSCHHHSLVSGYMKKNHELGNEPFDIEDLVNIGRTKGPCPYYISRELHKVVDILFTPYNYLIDPGNRRSLTGIDWGNAVLIFDEAHNLESICADAASFDLPSGYLTACISEAKDCVDLCISRRAIEKSTDKQFDPDNYAILKALLLKLEKRIAEVPIESKDLGFTQPGHYIYELLSDMKITYETANMLIDTIENAALLLEEGSMTENGAADETKGTICKLESIKDILKIIFKDGGKGHAKFYRESRPSITDSSKGKVSRTLSWWCFNPGLAMREFVKLGVRSMILTSGTLSPLDSFALEFNLEFPLRLENPHVISPNQVWVGVVPSGPSGYSFNSSYHYRDSLEYKQELGNAIVNFARIVPDGLLVFFPSYYLMDQCIECWKNMSHASSTDFSTIWERICRHKQPVVEPKQSALFPHAIKDFDKKLHDKASSGAIFFAVCRGKVSEGLDFADQAGRAVVITGMPFSTKSDPKIRLKREYLDQQALSQKKGCKVLTGEEWYVQQAARAVNQAVGRVIRHRHDYGAIIFCDERFAQQSRQCQMSFWLRPHIKCYPKFGDAVFTLTRFFRDKGTCCPGKPKQAGSLSIVSSDSVFALKPSVDVETNEPASEDIISVSEVSSPVQEKIGLPQDKIFSAKALTCMTSAAEHYPRKPLSSVLAAIRADNNSQLQGIVPANRSSLSNKHNFQFSSKRLRDPLYFQNGYQSNESNKKDPQHQDNEVVDLTSDDPVIQQPRTEYAMAPCSSKSPKILKMDDDAVEAKKDASLRQLHNADLRPSLKKSCISNSSETDCIQILQLPSCGLAEVGMQDKDRSASHALDSSTLISNREISTKQTASKQTPRGKEVIVSSSFPCDEEETRGSAFLMQVQEKLTGEEYKEFVGLMKALKSKTMKIIPVLESIARLFSSPGRFFLLKRFKDYVPAKYHPIYEKHLKAHDAAV